MGLFKKTSAAAADTVAAAVITAGAKTAGQKGVNAANKITSRVLGRTYQPCTDPTCTGNCTPAS